MSFPALSTPTPLDGQRLAREFADALLAALPASPDTMPEMLRTDAAGRLHPAMVTAIYFHAISLANNGWRT